ncbi:MAG TPA: hypothetical protein VGL54_06695 [Solirubrobacteraceae bacterium]
MRTHLERFTAPLAIAAGAVVLWVVTGVGFANYDTLYALAWGGQLARGETPQYGIPIAPTPHPLVEVLGVVLSPLSPGAVEDVTVALGFLALSACGWVLYRLGSLWFGRAAGALAALILLTRVPVFSYGVRAYVDIPYLLLVLSALLVEARHHQSGIDGSPDRPAGAPVLALLALAGLLRPEAWAFSGLYWLYLMPWTRRTGRALMRKRGDSGDEPTAQAKRDGRTEPAAPTTPRFTPRRIVGLTLLAAAAPLVWVVSDWLVTGHPLWSLTNTQHTAETLDRVTGIANVPEYIPRRIGEILSPPVLAGAALGGVLSLWLLPRRARLAAVVGVVAVVVFATFATAGLPINTRYAFLAAAILCVFCGAGVFGWTRLPREDPRRRWWMAGGALVLVVLLAYIPTQYRTAHRELTKLARQEAFQNDLVALVENGSITRRCEPVGVPNHAPIPLLALYLGTSPREIVSAETGPIAHGTYIDPASVEVEKDYVLDPHDPHLPVEVPPGFTEAHANSAWFVFEHCP